MTIRRLLQFLGIHRSKTAVVVLGILFSICMIFPILSAAQTSAIRLRNVTLPLRNVPSLKMFNLRFRLASWLSQATLPSHPAYTRI